MRRRDFLASSVAVLAVPAAKLIAGGLAAERHFLYIVEPGIRNYVSYGGVGILVYDIDQGYKFVRRIPTWSVAAGEEPDNVKGVAASAKTGQIYITTTKRLAAFDLATDKMVWDVAPEGGCDRPSVSPDGSILYVPSFEGPHWNVVDTTTGATMKKIVMNSRAHNTLYSLDGAEVYLAGLASTTLSIADPKTHTVSRGVGPFAAAVRPFTVNGARTIAYVNVNQCLGFEIGDIRTGKKLHRVEVQGYQQGPVDRHGCPSHGIGLTPDETELWVADGHNKAMHIFDNTVLPPQQKQTIMVRDQPGWITFSIDGRHAYLSTGEVFDTKTKKRIIALDDETGRQIGSEKLLEVVMDGNKVIHAGDQFGIGMKK
jgi:DNA-binding beta-propeller fold protein YncE